MICSSPYYKSFRGQILYRSPDPHKKRRQNIFYKNKIRHQQLSQENASKEILAAFKQSDLQKRGFITAQELRQILTTTGEKVTSENIKFLEKKSKKFNFTPFLGG